MRMMLTYISPDRTGNDRIRLEVVSHANSSYRSLLVAHLQHDFLAVANKIKYFSHTNSDNIKAILRDAGRIDADASRTCNDVFQSCSICAAIVRPAKNRKISLTHVNYAFNQDIQADLTIGYIQGDKYEVLNLRDVGNRYGERTIASTLYADTVKEIFESTWMYQHGAPERLTSYK